MRIFPVTITEDSDGKQRKVPLTNWRSEPETATCDLNDNVQIDAWSNYFKDKLHYWGTPTGESAGILVLDVDPKNDGFESLQKLQIPLTRTQRTRSGGLHYIFKYPMDGRSYGNRVGVMPGLDVRGDGGYIVFYGMDQNLIAEAPEWLLNECHKTVHKSEGSVLKVAPEIAQGILENSLTNIREAPQGESNNVLNEESFKVGQLVASDSINGEYAEKMLMKAALERGKPHAEAKATIASGFKGGAEKPITCAFGDDKPVALFDIPDAPEPEGRWTPQPFTKYDLMNASELRRPQIFKNWSTEDIHLTTADGGTGKTTLKIFEAVCLALGQDFLGFTCREPGRTLFITGEDRKEKIGAMIGMVLKHMGLFMADVPGNEEKVQKVLDSILVKKCDDLSFIAKDHAGFLQPNPVAMTKVMEAVTDHNPKFIVIDPISSFWASEAALNDMAKAVSKFVARLSESAGACVEMINHMGKDSSRSKDMSQFSGRGGSGLPSHARVVRTLRPVYDDEYMELIGEEIEEEQKVIMCNVGKFTDGSPISNKPFLIIRDGFTFFKKDIGDKKAIEEIKKVSYAERIFTYIQEQRNTGKYPTDNVCIGHFNIDSDPIKQAVVKRTLQMLEYQGYGDRRIRHIENPDTMVRDKAIVIIDENDKEI